MKLLIVSSEHLHPGDTLMSSFELSQALVLRQACDVAILAVRVERGTLAEIRNSVRRFILGPSLEQMRDLSRCSAEWLKGLSRRAFRRLVKVHVIEGVPVYEAVAEPVVHGGFGRALDLWLGAARRAFDEYCAAHGLPDLLHAHGRFLNAGAFALEIRRRAGIPFVYTDHSSFYRRGLAPVEAGRVLLDIVREASVFTAVSASLLDDVQRFLKRDLTHGAITPNTIDPLFESAPLVEARPDRPFVFVFVGFLVDSKGIDVLLRAFKSAFGGHPDYHLKVCGDGPLRNDLQKLARQLGLANCVTFLGRRDKRDVMSTIDHSHVLVSASRIETFGVTLIEALSRGKPVIATHCGGPSTIVGAEAGILVAVDDVTAFAEAMKRMVETYHRYDAAAIRDGARRRYGSAAFRERMAQLYERVLHGRPGAAGNGAPMTSA